MLSCLVDPGQVSHPQVTHRAGSPHSQLSQTWTRVADHAEDVIVTETAQVEGDQVGEVAEAVRDNVEVVLKQVLTVGDVIVLTLNTAVI